MKRHLSADFGNTMAHLGEDGELDSPQTRSTTSQSGDEEPAGGACSQQMCGGMAAAAGAAIQALGPPGKKIAAAELAALANDKSPAGQAQYQAALEHNAEVDKQNAERQGIIDQFVKDAIGGKITKEQIALGDAAHAEYEKFVAKHGEEVRHMTLNEVLSKYPEDSKAMINALAQVFPGLRGKSPEQVLAMIPPAMKNMQMIDLEGAVPNSSWLGTKTSSGQSVGGTGVALGAGAIALAGLAAFFIMMRRKNAPRT